MISKKLVMKLIDERIAELANGLFVVDLTISNTNVIHVEIESMLAVWPLQIVCLFQEMLSTI